MGWGSLEITTIRTIKISFSGKSESIMTEKINLSWRMTACIFIEWTNLLWVQFWGKRMNKVIWFFGHRFIGSRENMIWTLTCKRASNSYKNDFSEMVYIYLFSFSHSHLRQWSKNVCYFYRFCVTHTQLTSILYYISFYCLENLEALIFQRWHIPSLHLIVFL